MSARRELWICLAVATAIVALQSYVLLRYEQFFDSDQAVYGLMAKHLSEFRTFPLFFYGQNYMLGVQSWLAVPFFWIGDITVAWLRTPIVLLNLSVALGFTWFFVRQGLRPVYALCAAMPVIAFTPVKALEFGAIYGAGIEPFGYALILWLLRHRPLAYGAVLGVGTLHREFTFLALPALAIATWDDRRYHSWRSLAGRVAGFAVVWLVVDILKRNINTLGPAGGTFESGSVALGAKTFLSWLSFDWAGYAGRTWEMITKGFPVLFGGQPYFLRAYSSPVDMEAGSLLGALALSLAIIVALGRTVWVRVRGAAPLESSRRQLARYFVALAVLNLLIYGLNSGIALGDTPILRYVLFAPLALIAIFAVFFTIEHGARWRAAVGLSLAVWTGTMVVDNARLIRRVVQQPPASEHRELADYLVAHGVKYAWAVYWDAYVINFFTQERVTVASTTSVRISAYQEAVEAHPSETYTLRRWPCEGGPKVAGWCVIPPDGH